MIEFNLYNFFQFFNPYIAFIKNIKYTKVDKYNPFFIKRNIYRKSAKIQKYQDSNFLYISSIIPNILSVAVKLSKSGLLLLKYVKE
jgi:hypothetical protein